jgi:hypothetical protein
LETHGPIRYYTVSGTRAQQKGREIKQKGNVKRNGGRASATRNEDSKNVKYQNTRKKDCKEQHMKKQLQEKNKRKERRKNKNKENYASSLETEVASCSFSETSVTTYQSTRCHIQVDFNLHAKRAERTSILSQNYTCRVLYSAVRRTAL